MNAKPPEMPTRAELYAQADAYLAALAAKDPSRLKWADQVLFSENNVRLMIGDGLWNTASGIRPDYDLKIADPVTGQVAWFGRPIQMQQEPADGIGGTAAVVEDLAEVGVA